VRVKNITLYKTLTSVDQYSYTRPQGYNHIEIQQLERPLPMNLDLVKVDYLPRIHKGTTGMIIRPDMGWRDPPAMQLFLYPGHFAQ
jgi:hypothetical protein